MYPWQNSKRFLQIIEDPFYRQLVALQDGLQRDSSRFWTARNLLFMFLPMTTQSISSPMGLGSDSKPLAVEIGGARCYLADSMQFMLEYGCRFNPQGAWYIMPSFRAEQSDETHLNEFFHSEAEITGGLDDVMTVVEEYLRDITAGALSRMQATPVPGQKLSHIEQFLRTDRIPQITFEHAARLLDNKPEYIESHHGWRTITRQGERQLMAAHGGAVWLTHFDHLSVPFYQAYSSRDVEKTAANADLLLGIGEMVGCGERHPDGESVEKALAHHQVPPHEYAWYIDMKSQFPMQTSGFGLGVERWLQWLTDETDIRNLQLVPRIHGFQSVL